MIYTTVKRALDVVLALIGTVVLGPLLLGCAAAVKRSSPGPVLFKQARVGRGGNSFILLKFRSMSYGIAGAQVTAASDPRITDVGRWLRKYKLDELPQLLNVLRGDMSIVGPRPEVAKFVEQFSLEYRQILSIRPGITDFAAVEYRDEELLLAVSPDPERTYIEEILPQKIVLYMKYLNSISFSTDLMLVMRTLRAVIR